MAGEELQVVRLKTEFYRDGFPKVLIALAMTVATIALLIAISIYLHVTKPDPVYFATDNEWRILPPVPLDQPYLKTSDLLQWVSEALPASFTLDFLNYKSELENVIQYYTPAGWQRLLGQLNSYANYNAMQTQKMFVSGVAAGAPFILNQGLLNGKYSWWVQMPLTVNYNGVAGGSLEPITLQVLVVRVPTLNNYYGTAIENMIITKGQGNQVRENG